jgi:hypothetical protein
MDCEPPYTRPAWPVLSKVEGYGGVRGALRQLMAEPSTRLAIVHYFLSALFSFSSETSEVILSTIRLFSDADSNNFYYQTLHLTNQKKYLQFSPAF